MKVIDRGKYIELLSKTGSRYKLKRFVKPSKKFWIGLGLYEAEKTGIFEYGIKEKRTQVYKVAFTNQNPEIILCILEMFVKLGIEKSTWKGEIGANLNYIDKKEFEKRTPKYWSKKLDIPLKNFDYFKYDKRKPKKTKKYKKQFNGILTLYQNNICLKSFLTNFVSKCISR